MRKLKIKDYMDLAERVNDLEHDTAGPNFSDGWESSILINWFLTVALVVALIVLGYNLKDTQKQVDHLQDNALYAGQTVNTYPPIAGLTINPGEGVEAVPQSGGCVEASTNGMVTFGDCAGTTYSDGTYTVSPTPHVHKKHKKHKHHKAKKHPKSVTLGVNQRAWWPN